MRTWLKNATLIDGTGAPARDGGVVIEGETIVHVGPLPAGDAPSGADTEVVDLPGRTVIPGDCMSSTKYEMPRCASASGSVRASRIPHLATCAPVVQIF